MPELALQLLGAFRLQYQGETLTGFQQPRRQALLGFLIIRRGAPLARRRLATHFWPDSPPGQARTNLRRELNHLRTNLPNHADFVTITRAAVEWRTDVRAHIDIVEFQTCLEAADKAVRSGQISEARRCWSLAVDHYGGPLLPQCYDDWIFPLREEFHHGYVSALEHLIVALEDLHRWDETIRQIRRLLAIEPLHEASHRRLMRVYAIQGERSAALRVYRDYATRLRRELDVEPDLETQQAYQRLLRRPSQNQTNRVTAAPHAITTPLVGREQEWRIMRRTWRIAQAGRAHMLLLTGDPGMGKSRLAEELLSTYGNQGIHRAHARAYAAQGALPYAPVIEWLRSPDLHQAWSALDRTQILDLAQLLPDLFPDGPDQPQPAQHQRHGTRHRLFEAMARAVLAGPGPRLLILDDLQWCDTETLEWLRFLMHFAARARLLLVGTARAGEIPDQHEVHQLLAQLRVADQLTELALSPLSDDAGGELAGRAAGQELDQPAVAQLLQAAEGNPLFIIELARYRSRDQHSGAFSAQERADPGRQAMPALPGKIEAVIRARLVFLSPEARELASIASCIGREFRFDVLSQVMDGDQEHLVRRLDELWRRGIVRELGVDVFDFSHDLIREVAYAEISTTRRRVLHLRIGRTLAAIEGRGAKISLEQIAHQFDRGGAVDVAVGYYQKAGEAALAVHAARHAATLLQRALVLLPTVPETDARLRAELDLQLALGLALTAAKGSAAPGAVYLRAQDLCAKLRIPTHFEILRALGSVYMVGGELNRALEVSQTMLTRAREADVPENLVEAHYSLGIAQNWMGNFGAAHEHLTACVDLYSLELHSRHMTRFPHDPGVIGRIWLALNSWFLGYPDRARALADESLTLARDLSHPITTAYAWVWYAKLYELMGIPSTTLHYAEKAAALAAEFDLPLWTSQSAVHMGWARAELGNPFAQVESVHAGLIAHMETGARVPQSWHMTLLARVHALCGQWDQGIDLLTAAIDIGERTGIKDCQAECYRLKGELLLHGDKLRRRAWDEAEQCFLRSLAIARGQAARSLELRSAISLASLRQRQDRPEEARTLLAPIYAWFQEGFDTPDLQRAAALLTDLA